MKEHPIIFNAAMVNAILSGSKTQTRRPVKFPFIDRNAGCELSGNELAGEISAGNFWNSPFGQPGDRLWVRENFYQHGVWSRAYYGENSDPEDDYFNGSKKVIYAADNSGAKHGGTRDDFWRGRPSIHMPRWASRITLEITGVRVERLQDISQKDAIAEGGPPNHPSIDAVSRDYGFPDFSRSWFGQTWDHIYGEESWQANPWVWVIEFKRVEGVNHD